jgi:hypothetical protein
MWSALRVAVPRKVQKGYSGPVKHKGDPQPTTGMEWVGRAFLVAVPLGFVLAAATGHIVLALVLVTPLGAYAQWSIWVHKRRLEGAFAPSATREQMRTASD